MENTGRTIYVNGQSSSTIMRQSLELFDKYLAAKINPGERASI